MEFIGKLIKTIVWGLVTVIIVGTVAVTFLVAAAIL
jgi:hypothetical protein